jgi:hypothetical protein
VVVWIGLRASEGLMASDHEENLDIARRSVHDLTTTGSIQPHTTFQ